MYFRSGEQIFQELQEAIRWFESVGISTQQTRIQAISHYVFDQITGLNPGTTVPEPDHSAIISDASGFALISKEFSRIPSNLLPRRTLKAALHGQLCPSNEDPRNSDARNKFFELELAAHLSVAGVKLVGKAYSQLGKRLKGPMDRGIAAIAIEKVLTLDDKIREIDSSVEAVDFAKAHCETLKQRIGAYSPTPDVRIVGVLFVSRFLMHLQARSINAVNYLIGTLPFRHGDLDPLPEESRLLRFTAHLSGNFGTMA